MNAIFYVRRAGCACRLLPKDFPPSTTVYGWFLRFRHQGLFETKIEAAPELTGHGLQLP
jgi:putative transposase